MSGAEELVLLIFAIIAWIAWTLVFKETKPWMDKYPWASWAGYVVIVVVFATIYTALANQ